MTKISWVQNPDGSPGETMNPIVGCSPISEACRSCYAASMASRWAFHPNPKVSERYQGVTANGKWTGKLNFVPSELEKPYRWKKPRTIFVGSMTDLFHPAVERTWLLSVLNVVYEQPQHTYIFLTKRAENMYHFFASRAVPDECPPNLWLGVTCENQETADARIPWLLKTPAAKRFVSCEPLLSAVDLTQLGHSTCGIRRSDGVLRPLLRFNALTGHEDPPYCDGEEVYKNTLDWVIAGCESGPKRRETNPDWIYSLLDQCQDAEVPFFLKQVDFGEGIDHEPMLRGKAWREKPEVNHAEE